MTSVSSNQPGSSNDQNDSPHSKPLVEKQNMRELNQRLEMFVSSQRERNKEIEQLKTLLANTEMEFRRKMNDNQKQFEAALSKIRNENETYQFTLKTLQEEVNVANQEKKDYQTRLEVSESKIHEHTSRIESILQENNLLKRECDTMRSNYGALKYKHENYENERNSLHAQINSIKEKYNIAMLESTKKQSELRAQQDTFTRILKEKSDEIEKMKQQMVDANVAKDEVTSRLKNEFDQKLKEYVDKREEQYKLEKEEWMRIFKEEYNRKLRAFKEANDELCQANQKNEEELNDLRSRLAQLKQSKTELEATNRNLEEELDKVRNDLDALRQSKDEEIRQKTTILNDWKDKCKQKEIEFDELNGIKIQLTQEIDLYRQILSEAEKCAGYASPLEFSRKKRKINRNGENNLTEKFETTTPGIFRGAQLARKDLNCFDADANNSNESKLDENKDVESDPRHNTPGESYPLQFSTIDLSKSMIEIQNISEQCVCLKGYTLTNQDGSCQFPLPPDKILQPNERIKVFVGSREKAVNGSLSWKADVWSGQDQDEARLYDPSNREIAQIQISPDMLPSKSGAGCLVM